MKRVYFTPTGFEVGYTYIAQLIKDGVVQSTITSLVNNVQRYFDITTPGTYTISVLRTNDNSCLDSITIQAYFPVVTSEITGVNCLNNTYTVVLTLTNPDTAGSDVQYGMTTSNNCTSVTSWQLNGNFSVPADDVVRYFFVRNSSQDCCNYVTQNVQSPCPTCTLAITNVTFDCNP